jgi:hypothetical protein
MKIYGTFETDQHASGTAIPQTVVYRLSSIGDRLPNNHVYPVTARLDLYRMGAQAFATPREALGADARRMTGDRADRLLLIRVASPRSIPTDESGWLRIVPEDVIEVRRVMLDDLPSGELDAGNLWDDAERISSEWIDPLRDNL